MGETHLVESKVFDVMQNGKPLNTYETWEEAKEAALNPPTVSKSKSQPKEDQIKERYTTLSGYDGSYTVRLKIDHQSFYIGIENPTKKRAEWYRDQLAKALCRMLETHQKG